MKRRKKSKGGKFFEGIANLLFVLGTLSIILGVLLMFGKGTYVLQLLLGGVLCFIIGNVYYAIAEMLYNLHRTAVVLERIDHRLKILYKQEKEEIEYDESEDELDLLE